jgi:hypothetical protein
MVVLEERGRHGLQLSAWGADRDGRSRVGASIAPCALLCTVAIVITYNFCAR